jgi:SOS-response transcriptional repressor LexA
MQDKKISISLLKYLVSLFRNFQGPQTMYRTSNIVSEKKGGEPVSFSYLEVTTDSMSNAGIKRGDKLVVNRKIPVANGNIVIAILNNVMLLRRIAITNHRIQLIAETSGLSNIDVDTRSCTFSVWGVVTHVIKPVV